MTDLATRQLDMLFSEFVNSFELMLSGIFAIRVLRWMVLFSAPAEAWAASTTPNNVGIWRQPGCQLQFDMFQLSGYPRELWDQPQAGKHVRESQSDHQNIPKTFKIEKIRTSRKLRKLQVWSIFTSKIFNFPMLTHVSRGPPTPPI